MVEARRTPTTGGLQVYLRPGDTVIDVGANVGRLTRAYADVVGLTGRVIACEPLEASAETLRQSCAAFPQVEVRSVAVDATARIAMLYQGKNSVQCSLWVENVPDQSRTPTAHAVFTVTLDMIALALPVLHGVKIDAQGAEGAIVQGASETLRRPETVWMIEVWPDGLAAAGSSLEALVETLQGAGLSLIAEGKEPQPRATLRWADILKTRRGGHQHTNIICRHAA